MRRALKRSRYSRMPSMTKIFGKLGIKLGMATRARSTQVQYLALVSAFPLRPIRTRAANEQAKYVLRKLSEQRGAAARDYKAVLVCLIADYERSAHLALDISKVTAKEIVVHLL